MLSFKEFLNEKWGADTAKATMIHYRIERKRGNPLMHPAAIAGISAVTAAAAATGNFVSPALMVPPLMPHFIDIINIRKKIKEIKAREQTNVSTR